MNGGVLHTMLDWDPSCSSLQQKHEKKSELLKEFSLFESVDEFAWSDLFKWEPEQNSLYI